MINEEKRNKFIEYAGKRVNNVLHDIQILEPMARSNSYDFTKEDVNAMFTAMQEALNDAKEEFSKKFEEKARAEKKTFSFNSSVVSEGTTCEGNVACESTSASDATSAYSASNTGSITTATSEATPAVGTEELASGTTTTPVTEL